MAASLPQSVAPGVAFEIDLEKKTDSPRSAIQKRLENSPRRGDTRLEDVQAKLKKASERKGQLEAEALAGTASHNAKVQQVHETSKAEAADKLKKLSDGAAKRLAAAEAKRDGHRDSWMRKLGAKLTDKKQRGDAAKEEAEWAARDVAAKIDIAAMSADLRRQEATLKVQETLGASNNDKLARGKLALDLSALEAEKVEERSQQKLVLAEERREMLLAESTRDTAAARAEKVAEARRLEEEAAASKRKAKLEAKLLAAEERKDAALAGKVETLASRLDDKAQRAADARKKEEALALDKGTALDAKLQSASARKAQAVRQQQQLLHRSASKKELLVLERQEAEEKALAEARANVHSKLQSASARKETLLKEKVDEVKGANQKKQHSAKKTWLSSLKSERRLKDESEKRLKAAAQRKETLLKEKVDEAKGANRQRAEQVEAKQKEAEKADALKLGEIESKIRNASAKRDKQLGLRSTSKKRQLSPSSSPRDKAEIEARIEAANTRREQFLAAKVEKAQKSPRINKTLFSAVSPSPGIRGSGENLTSRMKAARLEEFERSSPIEEKSAWDGDGGNPHQPPGLGMIALGSGLAIVLVGLFSFLKK